MNISNSFTNINNWALPRESGQLPVEPDRLSDKPAKVSMSDMDYANGPREIPNGYKCY